VQSCTRNCQESNILPTSAADWIWSTE